MTTRLTWPPLVGFTGRPLPAVTLQSVTRQNMGDAGRGSQIFAPSGAWRVALLGMVVAGALMVGPGRSAQAQDGKTNDTCDDSGVAPNIKLTCNGDITATGDGIFVEANGGTVTVEQTGNINAEGAEGIAIHVKNTGSNHITLRGGTIHGDLAGVYFQNSTAEGSSEDTLTIENGASLSGGTFTSGYAIVIDEGNKTIINHGIVTGNVTLGNGTNVFNNQGGVFNSGETVAMHGGVFENAGDWSPFGIGNVGTSRLFGHLMQTSSGTMTIDIDGDEADKFVVTVGNPVLAGTIVVHVVNLPTVKEFWILRSLHALTDKVPHLLASPALRGELSRRIIKESTTGSMEVWLTIDSVDFTGEHNGLTLNRNQTAVGGHLKDLYEAGADSKVLNGLANVYEPDAYKNALDQLLPEIYGDTQIAALNASMDFSSNLLHCRVDGTDTASFNREGQCLWVGAKARFLDSERTSENIGFDETAGLFAAGAQVALDPVWRLGFGVGYQTSSLNTDTGAKSDGDQVQGAIALKYNPGALLLAGVVSGGRGWYDTTRPMAFGDFAETANGDHEIDVLAGRLHASYVFGSPDLYVKPLLDAAATRLDLGDVTETGAPDADLVVHGDDQTVFSVSSALEVGTEWWLGNGTLIRPFVRAGATWFSDDQVALSASFAGTPDGVTPFTIRAEMDQVQADVAAGVEMINSEDSNLRVYYDGHFGDTTQIHSVGLKGSATF